MSTDPNARIAKKPSRVLKLALMASLAVNLLVFGAVAGAFLREGEGPRGQHGAMKHGPSSFGSPYIRALSKEDRRAVGDKVRGSGMDREVWRQERKAMYAEVLSAVRAEPFAEEALADVLQKQAGASQMFLQVSLDAWLSHISDMEPQARAVYADRLEDVLARKRKPRKER